MLNKLLSLILSKMLPSKLELTCSQPKMGPDYPHFILFLLPFLCPLLPNPVLLFHLILAYVLSAFPVSFLSLSFLFMGEACGGGVGMQGDVYVCVCVFVSGSMYACQ